MRLSNTTSACMTRQDGSRIPINEGIELLYAAGFRGWISIWPTVFTDRPS